MLFRQDWVEDRGRREAHGREVWKLSPPPKKKIIFFVKLIAENAFSKHFKRFLVTLKEWVIPRKRLGKLNCKGQWGGAAPTALPPMNPPLKDCITANLSINILNAGWS